LVAPEVHTFCASSDHLTVSLCIFLSILRTPGVGQPNPISPCDGGCLARLMGRVGEWVLNQMPGATFSHLYEEEGTHDDLRTGM
jgi:hypothetical protein